MASQPLSTDTVGVIGAGSFGTAVANLLAQNKRVLLYARRPEVARDLNKNRSYKGRKLNQDIELTHDLEEVAKRCELIFPIVPSENFRGMLKDLAPFLYPNHMLIHGTKGLAVSLAEGETLSSIERLDKSQVNTMSELIREETVVRRIGCMAGPNIAYEIDAGEPAATVIASRFDEVIREGQMALRSPMFRVHGNHDLIGIELAGVLKNIMAIVAGIINGLGYGANTRGLFVTRGLAEVVHIGTGLGADPKAFFGLAGIGDLVTTATSPLSRNFIVGQRLAAGEKVEEIISSMDEVAEGIKTVKIIRALAQNHKIAAPITLALYKTLFEGMDIAKAVRLLMEFPFREDVEFL